MPIKFRCPHCRQFLGISRSKAGSLSDCPTCGRSIRVPMLDGRVEPLPEPLLNLGDERLSKALDVLAQLDESPAEDLAAGGIAVASKSAAVAIPSIRPPLASAQAVRDVPPLPPKVAPAASPPASKGLENALNELGAVVEAYAEEAPERTPPRTASSRTWGFAGLGTVVGLGLGIWIGRWSVVPAAAPLPPQPVAIPEVPPAPAAGENEMATAVSVVPASADFHVALTGQITYTTGNGESRPDAGARVLVFPEVRQGAGKLPVVGFSPGAGEADSRLSRAALRSVGGDFAVADDQGHYELSLPAAGTYRLLIVSRYQDQAEAVVLENSLRKLLDDYFDRPNRVIGQVKHHFGSFRFDGQAAATRSHGFTQ